MRITQKRDETYPPTSRSLINRQPPTILTRLAASSDSLGSPVRWEKKEFTIYLKGFPIGPIHSWDPASISMTTRLRPPTLYRLLSILYFACTKPAGRKRFTFCDLPIVRPSLSAAIRSNIFCIPKLLGWLLRNRNIHRSPLYLQAFRQCSISETEI